MKLLKDRSVMSAQKRNFFREKFLTKFKKEFVQQKTLKVRAKMKGFVLCVAVCSCMLFYRSPI